MNRNYVLTDINHALHILPGEVMAGGRDDESRAGKARELLHVGITLTRPLYRETTNAERKGSIAAQIAETMWVLSGRNDVEWLSHYLPRAKDFSDDGETWRGAYGKRIRAWDRRDFSDDVIDQLAWVIELLKQDPGTRRAVINIFDPVLDQQAGKDIPCNDWLDFKIRDGFLHVHVAIRSNDLIWGWSGINQFEWSVLQEIVAGMVGVRVGVLTFSISSLHIYEQHWGRADRVRFAPWSPDRKGRPGCPRFEFDGGIDQLDKLFDQWFQVEEVIRGTTSIPVLEELIANFPEPMMRSWLRVIAWWWTGRDGFLEPLHGTDLYISTRVGVHPKLRTISLESAPEEVDRPAAIDVRGKGPTDFARFVSELHETKHAAYGDSWKRRGEKVAIQANIARKVDRLGKNDNLETAADTAIDLLVYLLKYRWWLTDEWRMGAPFAASEAERTDEITRVRLYLERLDVFSGWELGTDYEGRLRDNFERLLRDTGNGGKTAHIMENLIQDANALARHEYWRANNAKRTWGGYGNE